MYIYTLKTVGHFVVGGIFDGREKDKRTNVEFMRGTLIQNHFADS